MLFKIIVCFAIAVSIVLSDSVKDELKDVYKSNGQPFYELPCIVIGGTCAKEGDCPKDSKVVSKGLCPVQQDEGIECCRSANTAEKSNKHSEELNIRCRAKGGDCVSTEDFECPQFLTVRDAMDCEKNEVCCVFVK